MNELKLNIENLILKEAKNDETWWGEFLEENAKNEKLHKILVLFIEADKTVSKKKIEEIRKALDKLPKSMKNEIEELEKRYVILEKREERRVQEDFGAALRYHRNLKKISLARLGELTNVSPSYINRIETGQRKAPSFPIIKKLAEALEISISDLIGSEDDLEDGNDEPLSLASAIYNKNIYITDKEEILNKEEKEALIDIITYIYKVEWKEDKHKEMLEIYEKIDNIKDDKI